MGPLFTLNATFYLHSALTLLHFLWQGLLLAIFAYLATWCLQNRSAAARCRVHVATLLLMLACLPATFAVLHRQEGGQPEALAVGDPGITAAVTSQSPFPISPASRAAVVAPLARWTTILYLLGVTAMFARMFLGLAGMRRLRRDATPLTDAGLLEAVGRQAQRLQLRHVPTVAYCRRVAVPALVGLWRPMIVLPTVLATGLTPEQLELVIVHEMAHIRRWDNAWIVVQRAIESILFFHPAVWYVSRRLSIERELCCDEMVVAMAAHRTEYAASLLRVAELTATGPAAVPVGANMTSPREGSAVFVHRLMRILGEAKSSPVRLLRFWPTLTVVLLIIATVCVFRLNVYAKRATATEMVLARSLVDKKLLVLHWEGLETSRPFKYAVTELSSALSNMEPNPQIFNPARTDSPQLDPVGQVLLDRLAPGEDEVFQRTDSGALRYLKRIRVEKSCVDCHASRGSVFDIGERQHPENRLKAGDVLAVVSLEIPAEP